MIFRTLGLEGSAVGPSPAVCSFFAMAMNRREMDSMRRSIMSGLTASDSFDDELQDSPSFLERCAADTSLMGRRNDEKQEDPWKTPERRNKALTSPKETAETVPAESAASRPAKEEEEIFEESEPEQPPAVIAAKPKPKCKATKEVPKKRPSASLACMKRPSSKDPKKDPAENNSKSEQKDLGQVGAKKKQKTDKDEVKDKEKAHSNAEISTADAGANADGDGGENQEKPAICPNAEYSYPDESGIWEAWNGHCQFVNCFLHVPFFSDVVITCHYSLICSSLIVFTML